MGRAFVKARPIEAREAPQDLEGLISVNSAAYRGSALELDCPLVATEMLPAVWT